MKVSIRRGLYKTKILFMGGVFYLLSPLYAQTHDAQFRRLSLEDGLSQNSVYCIFQDSKGFMWLGTEDGLNRYDGRRIKEYQADYENPHSISNNFVISIYEDRKGTLWIGTSSGGLNKFDRESENFTHYLTSPSDPNSLSQNTVTSICEDQSGILWIGTYGGLNAFDRKRGVFTRYLNNPDDPNSLSNNSVTSICQDKEGVLWIGTLGGGLNKFDPKKGTFVHYKADLENPNSLRDNRILSVYEDRSGTLWIGTVDGGLHQFDRTKERFISYQADANNPNSLGYNTVKAIYEDSYGAGKILWIGTQGGGLYKFDRERGIFIPYRHDPGNLNSISTNTLLCIYEDRSGVLWIGTDGGGVNRLDLEKKRFTLYRRDPKNSNSLNDNSIWAFCEDRSGTLWIGTHDGGLNRYDRTHRKFTHYAVTADDPNALSYNSIYAVYEDRAGILWTGTIDGCINRFDRRTGRYTHYQTDPTGIGRFRISFIYEDQMGTFWVGTRGVGLLAFDREKEEFIRYQSDPEDSTSLSSDDVYCIFENKSGELWIGTIAGGLNKYDRKKNAFTRYMNDPENPKSLSDNIVLTIYEDQKGFLWIGGFRGLNKFNREKGIFTLYSKKDGLPNDIIYGILEDDGGNLWMSTNKGLSKFNPQKETFRNYDINDGLQSNEFNAGAFLKSRSGEMFFGGINGFNSFYPDSIRDNPYVPTIVIADLQISNTSVPIGKEMKGRVVLKKAIPEAKEIELSYKVNVFSFEFAALHYVSPEKNQYAYKMEGLEKEWNYVGNRGFVTYTNLSPGRYVFRVKGSNNDGVWNEEGVSLRITISHPFWQTWWFRVFGITASLVLILTVSQVRTRAIRERNKRLEKRIEERTAELKSASKKAQHRAAQASLIYEVGQRVSGELKLEALLSEIVTAVQEAFNYYTVGLLLCDEEAGRLTLQSAAGSYTDVFPEGLWLAIGEGMIGYAAAIGETQVSGDVRKDTHYVSKAGGETKSELSVPIKSGDRVVGVLDIQSDKSDAFDETDVAAMETLSTQIATAIENARLYEKAQQEIAERKRVEDALRESGTLLRSTLESIEDGILVVNEKGKITHSNARFSEMWRVPKKIMAAKNSNALLEFVKNQLKNPKEFLAKVGKLYETTEQDFDTLCFKDGRIFERLSFPLVIDKKAQGRVWSFRDVTERTKAKEEIKRLKEFNEGIIQNMVGGIVVDNAAEKITFVNPAMMDILGYSYDELVGRHWKVLYPPDRHSLIEETNKLRMRGKSSRYEVEMLHKNGKRVPILVSGSPYFDNGHYGGTIAVIVDITELKRAEKELEKRQQYLESVLHDTPNAIVTTDSSFRVIEWNPGAEKIFGYTREEVLGKNIDDLVARSDVKEEAVALSEKHLSGERPSPLETVRYRKDGTPLNVIIAGSSIQVGGDIIGSVAVYTDITQRKLAEEASKQAELVQTTVYKIAASAHTVKSLEELFQSIHELIGILMPAKNFYIALHDPSTDLVHFPYYIDEYDQPPPPIKITEGLTGYVFRTGKPLLSTPEIAKELAATGEAKEMGASSVSWLGVPLKVENRVIGVLTVQSYEEDVRYGEEEKNILEFVSAQVAAAVHRKQAEEQIRASLQEKEMLLKEIHHRVKNNFQVIASLLHLQSRYIQDKTALNVFKESQDRIRSMALVHERLYQSKNLAKVDLNGYIEMLAKGLFRSYGADPKRISLITEVRDIALGIDIAIPCGLIVNELVSNSLKYGFPEGWKGKGEIRIALSQKNGFIDLVVSDNGVGLPEGLDIRNTESLGLRLVALLAEDQLQGKMTLGKKKGTQFHIQFKE